MSSSAWRSAARCGGGPREWRSWGGRPGCSPSPPRPPVPGRCPWNGGGAAVLPRFPGRGAAAERRLGGAGAVLVVAAAGARDPEAPWRELSDGPLAGRPWVAAGRAGLGRSPPAGGRGALAGVAAKPCRRSCSRAFPSSSRPRRERTGYPSAGRAPAAATASPPGGATRCATSPGSSPTSVARPDPGRADPAPAARRRDGAGRRPAARLRPIRPRPPCSPATGRRATASPPTWTTPVARTTTAAPSGWSST